MYVAKTFLQSGGGIAGFELTVTQLSGKRSGEGCIALWDTVASLDSCSTKQIFQADFLRLPPGGIVGYRHEYHGCAIASPGRFQLKATYCACDLKPSVVKSSVDGPDKIFRVN